MSTDREKAKANTDQLLNLYLISQNEDDAEPILIDLITNHAEPLIRKIIVSKTWSYDEFGKIKVSAHLEDLCSIVKLKLLSRLRGLRSTSKTTTIGSFLDYVAVASFHACNEYFRQQNPIWIRTRNHLRYILNHNSDFALWKTEKELLCGFSQWKGRDELCSKETMNQIGIENLLENNFAEQLRLIFRKVASPLRFVDVVNFFTSSIESTSTDTPKENLDLENFADKRLAVDKELELKTFLQELWNQILQLSLKQRTALLLSLRDENGSAMLHFFPMLGIAKIKELAKLLEMRAENFASMWRILPLEDNKIAEHLQVTRQQVINLRKCARERLSRKLRSK